MDNNINSNPAIISSAETEIDLKDILLLLWSKIWIILIATCATGLLSFIINNYFITPTYQSRLSLYVFNADVSTKETSANDLLIAQRLVNSYIAVLQSDKFLNKVIEDTHLNTTAKKLRKKIDMNAIKDTELFEIVVSENSPSQALKIANSITKLAPSGVEQIVKTGRTEVVDTPILADQPSSPNISRNTIIGSLIGFAIACAVVIFRDMFDITIKSKEELINKYSIPILGSIPLVEEEK